MSSLTIDGFDFTGITAADLELGDIVANMGVVEGLRRDGVFVVASVAVTMWSTVRGDAQVYSLDHVWHETDSLIVNKDPYNL